MPGQLGKIYNTTMGNTKSTNKNPKSSRTRKQDSRWFIQSDENLDNRDPPMEDPEISRLKKCIKNNPEVFILNNLMMCVEFFKNYDEEISDMRQTLVSPQETNLNKRLLPQKRVLLPDVLQERITNDVTFISRRETVDPTVEPLQPVRMFVVYENIDVSDQHDSSQYSTMNDVITYNMRLKPSKHKGYVHLQRTGITPSKRNPLLEEEVDLSSIAENGECFSDSESLYPSSQSISQTYNYNSSNLKSRRSAVDDNEVFYEGFPTDRNKFAEEDDTDYGSMSDSRSLQSRGREPRSQRRAFSRGGQYPKVKTRSVSASPASSTSSGYKSGTYDSDSEYGCSGKAPNKSKYLNPAEVPESCFCQVTYTPDDRVYDPLENKRKNISSKERRVQVERNRHNYDVWYLNSSKFRRRFYNVFIESLASLMDLEEVLKFRRPHFFESVIYCDKVEVSPNAKCNISESYEIIPCVWSQWPECANEWLERARHYWPTYEMIHHIRKSGCYIIPQEFKSKDASSNYKTEWQLCFPAAERYLETCMSHAQMKVYIIVLMLHKTFIRAVESAPDRLNTHQIRNQLFWLAEQSLAEWDENRTGDYLLKLLQCLCKCINQDEAFLKDYFLEEKNLFKNSEKGSLFFSLKQLKRILENPVMYVLHALENIRYTSQFFPKINYEELLKILTAEELLLINPNLEKNVSVPTQNYMEDDAYSVRRGFWDDAKKNKEQFSNFNKRPMINKTLINPSRAHDSVVDIAIRCGELRGIRLSKLLNFFIEHLIQMVKKYHEYGALQQKRDYLEHTMNLCILLAEDEMFQDEARSYVQVIVSLKKLVIRSQSQNLPPETPKRNVEAPKKDAGTSKDAETSKDVETSKDAETSKVAEISKDAETSKDARTSKNETSIQNVKKSKAETIAPNADTKDGSSVQNAETSKLSSSFNEYCSMRPSTSVSSNEAILVSQDPPEANKKISDSSIFSQSLKDRFSTISSTSIPLADTSASSSGNSSPPMKKKSDPPVYLRPLKDRFSLTSSNASTSSLSVLEEKKENDITSQSNSTKEKRSSVQERIKMFSQKEDFSKTNKLKIEKRVSQESKVISLSDDSQSSEDTYI